MVIKSDKLKISASAVKTYTQCPRKYYFTYINKLPKKKWPHIELGNFVHDVLESFHNTLRDSPKDPSEWGALLKIICRKEVSNHNLTKEQMGVAKEMLATYLSKLREDGLPNVLFNEKEFVIDLPGNILLRGFIDRVDEDADSVALVDYKSGRSKYLDEFQLLVYALAMLHERPDLKKIKGSYIVLGEGSKIIPYSFTKTDTVRCVTEITKVAGMIRSEQSWEPRPTRLCSYCDFHDACPATQAAKDNEWGATAEVLA